MSHRISLIGRTFGRLFVFAEAPSRRKPCGSLDTQDWVRCICGQELIVSRANLIAGRTKSCGCLNRDNHFKHGHNTGTFRSPTYSSWWNMIQRCGNENHASFHNYGGRGISVCERWRESFADFLSDNGECPEGMEIDRWPNNETGHYSCGQCFECRVKDWPFNTRWTTKVENNRNKRTNRRFTVLGIEGCLTELAEHFGLAAQTVSNRLRLGWPPEQAFTAPRRKSQYA